MLCYSAIALLPSAEELEAEFAEPIRARRHSLLLLK
jgi:hypothetical protein